MLPGTVHLGVWRALAMSAIAGFLFGTGFFLLGTITSRIRVRSFALNLLVQTLLTTLTVLVTGVLTVWTAMAVLSGISPFNRGLIEVGLEYMRPGISVPIVLAGTAIAGMINGFFAIDRKMGPGILWSWITGKYYNPKEEERIFMFLDMKDSTAIAEQLGNLKFSALVRDFFRDLTYPVLETSGEVSHYIGDEAVLTWKVEPGLRAANCAQLFFKFEDAIKARSSHYIAEYGLVPEFKAGLHIGKVVATEVGEVKSEIVFHGDVLNTAARIQGLCNEEGVGLLLSADLASRLELPADLTTRSLGMRSLKGKAHELEVFTLDGTAARA